MMTAAITATRTFAETTAVAGTISSAATMAWHGMAIQTASHKAWCVINAITAQTEATRRIVAKGQPRISALRMPLWASNIQSRGMRACLWAR